MTCEPHAEKQWGEEFVLARNHQRMGAGDGVRNVSNVGAQAARGHITSAKHGPLEPTLLNVQGTWMGDSLVRSCTLTGLTECPSLSRLFRLSLTHNGTSASGNLDLDASERFRIPVRGGFSASALTLEGVSSRQQAGGTFQQRLVAWTSRSDSFGRMNGTFTLEEESVSPDRRVVVHYESDLQDVYLIPDWFQPSSLASIAAAAGPPSLQPRLSVR